MTRSRFLLQVALVVCLACIAVGSLPAQTPSHSDSAGMDALRRIKANTIEKRLLNSRGEPNFNVNFYVLAAKGEHAGVALYGGTTAVYAACSENGPENRQIEALLPGTPAD